VDRRKILPAGSLSLALSLSLSSGRHERSSKAGRGPATTGFNKDGRPRGPSLLYFIGPQQEKTPRYQSDRKDRTPPAAGSIILQEPQEFGAAESKHAGLRD
jgi:hypothetical protein